MKDLGWLYSNNTFCQKFCSHILPTAIKGVSKNEHVFLCNYQRATFSVCVCVCVCFQVMLTRYVASQRQGRKTFIEITENQRDGKSSGSFPVEVNGFILLNNMAKVSGRFTQTLWSSGPLVHFPSHHSLLIESFFKIKFVLMFIKLIPS